MVRWESLEAIMEVGRGHLVLQGAKLDKNKKKAKERAWDYMITQAACILHQEARFTSVLGNGIKYLDGSCCPIGSDIKSTKK